MQVGFEIEVETMDESWTQLSIAEGAAAVIVPIMHQLVLEVQFEGQPDAAAKVKAGLAALPDNTPEHEVMAMHRPLARVYRGLRVGMTNHLFAHDVTPTQLRELAATKSYVKDGTTKAPYYVVVKRYPVLVVDATLRDDLEDADTARRVINAALAKRTMRYWDAFTLPDISGTYMDVAAPEGGIFTEVKSVRKDEKSKFWNLVLNKRGALTDEINALLAPVSLQCRREYGQRMPVPHLFTATELPSLLAAPTQSAASQLAAAMNTPAEGDM